MNKYLIISLMLVGCSKREVVQIYKGNPGANGHSIVSSYAQTEENELVCDESGGSRLDLYLDLDDSLSTTEGDIYLNSLVACNGLNGLNGADGLPGTDGSDGEAGPQGIQGEQGPQGAAGPQGLVGETGAVGATGAQGEAGPVGPIGPSGPQGLPGVPGTNGTNGTSATITSYTSNHCTNITGTSYYVKPNGSNSKLYLNDDCDGSGEMTLTEGDSMWLSTTQLATKLVNTAGIRVVKFN